MTKIVIRNLADLKRLQGKFRAMISSIPTLQKFALERAADEAVLTDIHIDMETNNFSPKIIDRTFVGPIETVGSSAKIHFISDFVADDGYDVSKGREEGTRDHDVFPKKARGWLTWIDQRTGKRVFRRKSHPSGIERLLIIEKNIAKNKPRFIDAYENNIAASLNQAVT